MIGFVEVREASRETAKDGTVIYVREAQSDQFVSRGGEARRDLLQRHPGFTKLVEHRAERSLRNAFGGRDSSAPQLNETPR